MNQYIQAWQCIGCGKIEAPQPCIGVCQDRKAWLNGKSEHERVLADHAALRVQQQQVRAMLLRFAAARPHEGQWQSTWEALQSQQREVLVLLADSQVRPPDG